MKQQKISSDYNGEKITMVSVLKGSFIFTADLIRSIDARTKTSIFIRAKSYIDTQSNGKTRISMIMLLMNQMKKHSIVEDIIDTGNTLSQLMDYFLKAGCKDVKIAVFLDKPSRRTVDISPDYCCFEIEDRFVVGYGLDYNENIDGASLFRCLTPDGN